MPSLLPLTSLAPATTRHHRFINILPFKASDDLVAVTARVTYDITIPLAVNRRLHTKDLLSHLMFTVGAVGWVELEVQTKVNGVKIDASAVVERVMGLLDVVRRRWMSYSGPSILSIPKSNTSLEQARTGGLEHIEYISGDARRSSM